MSIGDAAMLGSLQRLLWRCISPEIQHPLLWRYLSPEMQARLLYTEELATNLFVSMPVATKRSFIRHAQSVLGYPIFIETGTFMGDMSDYACSLFSQVHTVELSPTLAQQATERLAGKTNVTVHTGDSGQVLRRLLPTIDAPCFFWLDGHYSGGVTARGETDTPIDGELMAIADCCTRPAAIFIDDARVFGTDDAYPTLEETITLLRGINPSFHIGVTLDIIWATPVEILHFEWQVDPSGVDVPPSTAPTARALGSQQ
jgi:hypothetical protein